MKILDIPLLEKELFELNMNNDTQRIDHPAVYGSKDGSDSVACAVQNCINHRTVEDYTDSEYSEEDLVHAFVENTQQKRAMEQFFKVEDEPKEIHNITQKQEQKENDDDVDMEYFRF